MVQYTANVCPITTLLLIVYGTPSNNGFKETCSSIYTETKAPNEQGLEKGTLG